MSSIGDRMRKTIEHALSAKPHRFGVGNEKGIPTKFDVTPRLSAAGQFYLDCQKCGRAVFEDGSGSAAQATAC